VVDVEQTGYVLDGTVRRPAKVRVSDGTKPVAADPGGRDREPDKDSEPVPGGPPRDRTANDAAQSVPDGVEEGDDA
jgi:hypothetical protein